MALKPTSAEHAAQIAAGTTGRNRGHRFEQALTAELNALDWASVLPCRESNPHLVCGDPASRLLAHIRRNEPGLDAEAVEAFWLGGLATAGAGDVLIGPDGQEVRGSKSDVLLKFTHGDAPPIWRGVSVKTCFNPKPTNAQLYCSTASAFCALLRRQGLAVSDSQVVALRMFCGDPGFRPQDNADIGGRLASPERWFWEELPEADRAAWEHLLDENHAEVLLALLKYAYDGDCFPPDYLLHVRHRSTTASDVPLALFTMERLAGLSVDYGGFSTRSYRVNKGRFKSDPGEHLAPRFGIVQFQPLGNKQNRNQLQFNLQARYFDKVPYEG